MRTPLTRRRAARLDRLSGARRAPGRRGLSCRPPPTTPRSRRSSTSGTGSETFSSPSTSLSRTIGAAARAGNSDVSSLMHDGMVHELRRPGGGRAQTSVALSTAACWRSAHAPSRSRRSRSSTSTSRPRGGHDLDNPDQPGQQRVPRQRHARAVNARVKQAFAHCRHGGGTCIASVEHVRWREGHARHPTASRTGGKRSQLGGRVSQTGFHSGANT